MLRRLYKVHYTLKEKDIKAKKWHFAIVICYFLVHLRNSGTAILEGLPWHKRANSRRQE